MTFETITFQEWLELGQRNGWVGRTHCATHEGIPSTPDEDKEWDAGHDPCQHILRLYETPQDNQENI